MHSPLKKNESSKPSSFTVNELQIHWTVISTLKYFVCSNHIWHSICELFNLISIWTWQFYLNLNCYYHCPLLSDGNALALVRLPGSLSSSLLQAFLEPHHYIHILQISLCTSLPMRELSGCSQLTVILLFLINTYFQYSLYMQVIHFF